MTTKTPEDHAGDTGSVLTEISRLSSNDPDLMSRTLCDMVTKAHADMADEIIDEVEAAGGDIDRDVVYDDHLHKADGLNESGSPAQAAFLIGRHGSVDAFSKAFQENVLSLEEPQPAP